jgi:hypothetical protein
VADVQPAALKALFTALKDNVRLVVLNACYSKIQAQAISEVIDCVIGMNSSITDDASINFVASVYRAIGFGRSIQEAFDQGKVSLMLNGISEENIPELLVKAGTNAANIALLSLADPGVAASSSNSNEAPSSISAHTPPSKTDPNAVSIFISYAPQDRKWRDELVKHLSPMKRLGLISTWYDQNTSLSLDKESVAATQLAAARIILLLVSPDYLASDEIYDGDLQRALARHKAGTVRVIPILIRNTANWEETDFGKLRGLPRDDRSVQAWKDPDAAFAAIANEIRRVVKEIQDSDASS